MTTLHFDISIHAPACKVWDALWTDAGYRQWSSIFAPGSQAKSNWKEGSPVHFVDQAGNGVYSIIHKKVLHHHISFVNMCELFEGRMQVVDERTSAMEWSGAMENYWLNEKNGITKLWVEIQLSKTDAPVFAEKFPIALAKIKQIAEGIEEAVPFYQQPVPYKLPLAV
jgi:hypothetical protein